MNGTVKMSVNGKAVEAPAGKTILDVVRAQGLAHIPSICHDPMLPPYGSCFLCVVEVEGSPKLLPSCATPVRDGMVVRTDTPVVRDSRRMALELLLSNHYADCVAPCVLACPAGVDIQGYVALIAEGRLVDAVRVIRERNPMPLVCGRVCVRHCEVKGCRRVNIDEAVGVNNLKRYAADFEMENHVPDAPPPPTGRKVAVVGGGPAGLACAYYLRMQGHAVTVFEKLPKLGGMLRYGIPEYRLPRDVLDREIRFITTDLGVEVRTGAALGKEVALGGLRGQGFDATFLAIGAFGSKAMGIDGEFSTPGIESGVDFLMRQELEGHAPLAGKVVVVGGGNTAIDVTRTCLRLGAGEVVLLYRRTRAEMPADPVEIHDAEAEGVKLEFLAAPVGIVKGADGRVAGLACIRMELGEPDASGRRRPVPVKGSEHVVAADHVYSAIGQESILDGVAEPGCGVATTKWKTIVADEETLATALPGVFAGGDVVSGPDVVIGAIAHGRKAALSIDEYLRTGKVGKKAKRFVSRKDDHGIPEWEWEREKRARAAAPEEDPAARTAGFGEVTMHLMPETVAAETMRCLECGCQVYPSCELRKIADEYGVAVSRFKGEVKKSRVDDRHPFIRIDNNKCVLCARCIRTCADTLGVTALGFVGRGFRTEVHPAMNKALQETTCVACGNCADACPTGAIITRLPYVAKLLPMEAARTATTCTGCSLGCRRSVEAAARGLFWIAATGLGDETADNRGYLCLKGRYNIRHLLGADRLAAPLVRSGGALAEASWEKALDAAAAGIGGVAARHGPAGVALLAAPDRTSEELYLAQKYARVALGTSNVGSLSLAQAAGPAAVLGRAFGLPASTVGPAEVGAADVIVVAASDVDEESFVAGVLVKQAVKKGALLVVVGGRAGTLARCAEVVIPAQGEGGAAGALDEIARLAGGKEKVVALLGARAGEKECAALVGLMIATGKADKEGSGILLLEDHGNAQGARDMGIDPAFLPGYREAPREGKGALKGARSMDELVAALKDGTVKGLVAVGEDPAADPQLAPLLGKLEFLVVLEGSLTATAAAAHVVLPLASIVETDGTVTSSGRRVQRVRKAFEPACGKEGYQVLGELIARTSGAKVPVRALDAWEEIRPLFAPLAGIDLATLDEKPFSWRLPGSGVKPVKADGAAPAARHPFLQVEKEYATLRETYLPTGGKPPL